MIRALGGVPGEGAGHHTRPRVLSSAPSPMIRALGGVPGEGAGHHTRGRVLSSAPSPMIRALGGVPGEGAGHHTRGRVRYPSSRARRSHPARSPPPPAPTPARWPSPPPGIPRSGPAAPPCPHRRSRGSRSAGPPAASTRAGRARRVWSKPSRSICSSGLPAIRITKADSAVSTIAAGQREPAQPEPACGGLLGGEISESISKKCSVSRNRFMAWRANGNSPVVERVREREPPVPMQKRHAPRQGRWNHQRSAAPAGAQSPGDSVPVADATG